MDDLISRQALLRQIEIDSEGTLGLYGDTWQFINTIRKMPTVDRPRGEWISDRLHRLYTTNGGSYGVYRCSVCESYYPDIVSTWNFCPHCGADMKGEKNEQY